MRPCGAQRDQLFLQAKSLSVRHAPEIEILNHPLILIVARAPDEYQTRPADEVDGAAVRRVNTRIASIESRRGATSLDQPAPGRPARARDRAGVIVGAGAALDHADEDDVVGRVGPEPCAGRAVPEERSLAVGQIGLGRIEDHRAVVAVAEAGPHHVHAQCRTGR